MAIEALVSLKGENVPAVGRERLRLLEAVARERHPGSELTTVVFGATDTL